MHSYVQKNNSIGIILILVNSAAIILYLILGAVMEFFDSEFISSSTFSSGFRSELTPLLFIIFFVYISVRNYRAPTVNELVVNFPFALHLIVLILEIIYILYSSRAGSALEVQESMKDESYHVPTIFRFSTLIFYMTTMLLSMYIAKQSNWPVNKVKNYSIKLIAFLTIVVFVLKDYLYGSRGSVVNLIAFILAGWTYSQPMTFAKIIKNKLKIVTLTALFLIAITLLSFVRTDSNTFNVIWDSLFFRLPTNVGVSTKFLSHELSYRLGIGGEYSSDWMLAINEFGVPDTNFLLHLLPTFSNFMNKYILLNANYQMSSIYFDMYGNLPYNAFNFTLPLLASQFYGLPLFMVLLLIIRKISRLNEAVNFYLYCYLFYCAFLSFTSFSFFEIPFIFIPFFSLLFIRCIRLK
jgi:hypothetical protein